MKRLMTWAELMRLFGKLRIPSRDRVAPFTPDTQGMPGASQAPSRGKHQDRRNLTGVEYVPALDGVIVAVTIASGDVELPSAPASSVSVDASAFTGILSGTDTDAQTALDTIDDHNHKLDDLSAPDDTTDLNASTTAHGLLKKLSNVATEYLCGLGSWVTIRLGDLFDIDLTGLSDGDTLQYDLATTTWKPVAGGGGSGDVVGPASAVDDRICTFDGITGKLIQDGGSKISDLEVAGAAASAVSTHEAAADPHPQYLVDGYPPSRSVLVPGACDFLDTVAASISPFKPGAISTGTLIMQTPVADHPGVAGFRSHSSNANSGYAIYVGGYNMLMVGGAVIEAIFKMTYADNDARIGLMDGVSAAMPASGAFISIADYVCTGKTYDGAGNDSSTGTTYTLTDDTWYRARVEVNTARSTVTFTIYSAAGVSLWSDTLTTDLPGSSDLLTFAVVGTVSAPGGVARYMLHLDWLAFWCTKALTR